MIKKVREGTYTLVETKNQTKILTLDKDKAFAWIDMKDIGEILVTSHSIFSTDYILSIGKYVLFDVKNEEKYTDLPHLQLEVGNSTWQGYFLPNGLPDEKEKRHRIIPTEELVK